MNIESKETHYVFVVEGKTDRSKLIQAGAKDVVVTEGTKVPRETINYLKALEKKHNIVIFTDSDGPGTLIKNILGTHLQNPIIVEVSKDKMAKNETIGVENMTIREIQNTLAPYLNTEHRSKSDVTLMWLLNKKFSGPQGKAKRKALAKRFNLCFGSLKQMLRQIILLDMKMKDIEN